MNLSIHAHQNASFAELDQYCHKLIEPTPDDVFLSSPWIFSWYKTISVHHNPLLLVVTERDKPVALAVVHTCKIRRRHFFSRRVLFLNEFPLFGENMVIEYNGLIATSGYYDAAWEQVLSWIKNNLSWDEFQINRVEDAQAQAIQRSAMVCKTTIITKEIEDAPYVQLCPEEPWRKVERKNLSANRRRQIKRAKSLYEEREGKLTCSEAVCMADAEEYWSTLERLHTKYWLSKGQPGSFNNKSWVDFHQNLIADYFNAGYVQLFKVTAGNKVIGVVYNLIHDGRISNIQSGFNYEGDNRLKPGFLTHYLCIEYNHNKGAARYDFLGGGEVYKKSLSANVDRLYRLVVRRGNKRFWIEDALVLTVRRLRNLRNL